MFYKHHSSLNFRQIAAEFSGVPEFSNFTVSWVKPHKLARDLTILDLRTRPDPTQT